MLGVFLFGCVWGEFSVLGVFRLFGCLQKLGKSVAGGLLE